MTITQKEKTRDRILGAAEQVFANKGYHESLVDEIAEEQFEISAAFGPGVEVVNVVTGERVMS